MSDACKLAGDILRGGHITIREMPEVELDAGPVEPVEREFINACSGLSTVHRGGVVPRGVDMCAVVRIDLQKLDCIALAIDKLFGLQAFVARGDERRGFLVRHIFDRDLESGRIGLDIVLNRDRKIDHSAWHSLTSLESRRSFGDRQVCLRDWLDRPVPITSSTGPARSRRPEVRGRGNTCATWKTRRR